MRFSAVCYSFGREMIKQMGIPVGLIDSSVGGTNIEAWSSFEGYLKCNYTYNASMFFFFISLLLLLSLPF